MEMLYLECKSLNKQQTFIYAKLCLFVCKRVQSKGQRVALKYLGEKLWKFDISFFPHFLLVRNSTSLEIALDSSI